MRVSRVKWISWFCVWNSFATAAAAPSLSICLSLSMNHLLCCIYCIIGTTTVVHELEARSIPMRTTTLCQIRTELWLMASEFYEDSVIHTLVAWNTFFLKLIFDASLNNNVTPLHLTLIITITLNVSTPFRYCPLDFHSTFYLVTIHSTFFEFIDDWDMTHCIPKRPFMN